jgi:two-component system chemotaxis response regulator CheB
MLPHLIVIGAAAGELPALQALLAELSGEFPAPIVVVPHRGKEADGGLLRLLQRSSRLPIREPEDKEMIVPGCVFLAPRGYHLLVEKGYFAFSLAAPVEKARPSIDVLFESAADAYGPHVAAILLAGASDDGAQGLSRIKARGGTTMVQEPASAEILISPPDARLTAAADPVLPRPPIALLLNSLCPAVMR